MGGQFQTEAHPVEKYNTGNLNHMSGVFLKKIILPY